MLVFNGIYIVMALIVAYVYVTAIRNHSSKISNIFILFMFIQIIASISSFALIPLGNAKLIEWFISFKIFEIAISFLPLVWFLFVYEYLGKKVRKRVLYTFGAIYSMSLILSLYKNLDRFTIMFFDRLSPQHINNTFYIPSRSTLLYLVVTLILFTILIRDYLKEVKLRNIKIRPEILYITALILLMIISELYMISQILYSVNVSMFLILMIALIFLKLVANNEIKNLIQISNSLILDELPTAILILNDEKCVVYANNNAFEVFGELKYNVKFTSNDKLAFIDNLYVNESFEQNYESKVNVQSKDGKNLAFIATRTAYSDDFEIVRLQDITAEERNIESLHKKSRIDGLTELLNKATFNSESKEIIELCKMVGQSYAVVMFDLDKFKYVNDTYGHQKGDEVLITLAKTMRTEIILESLLGRFGGEEFCGLLIGDPSVIIYILDTFKEKFKKIDFEFEDGTFNVTLSIGVAFNEDSDELEELLNLADQALYNSKKTGRDKITVYNKEDFM